MLKGEARKVLGETAIFWQNPEANGDIKRRFWEHDFGELEKEAIRTLFGAPEWEIPEPNPEEPHMVTVNLATAVAIAKRYEVAKDELLAAIGLGEVDGIAPGSRDIDRDALVSWLEDMAVESYELPAVADEAPAVADEAPADEQVAVPYEPPQLTWWQANGEACIHMLLTVASVVVIVLCFIGINGGFG